MKALILILVLCLSALITACAPIRYGTCGNAPSDQKLYLQSAMPQQYKIHVASREAQEYPVGKDGRVTFHVPSLGLGTRIVRGSVVVSDNSPSTWTVIQIVKGTEVVQKLSLRNMEKLPLDGDGFRVLKLSE